MKSVLMVTHHFPPIGGPAVYPMLKFAKYLPSYGWRPVVLAGGPRHPDFEPDESLVKEIPDEAIVHRIEFPFTSSWRQIRKWLFSHHLGRIGHRLGFWKDFPCRFREWADRSTPLAERLMAQHSCRVVWTSSPALSTHLVGLRLKTRLGIPWVADFRDPWSTNPILMQGLPRWVRARHARLEARVARSADVCLFAHPLIAEDFRKRHGLAPERAAFHSNGFDHADYVELEASTPVDSTGRLDIVHTGSFYGDYSPQPLLGALNIAAKQEPELLKKIRFTFVGGCAESFDHLPGLEVRVMPRVAHATAIEWSRRADVLLIVVPNAMQNYCIPQKVYSYLAARRPILAIVPSQGSCAQIVREAHAGLVADPDAPHHVLKLLNTLVEQRESMTGLHLAGTVGIDRYSYRNLAGELAAILDRVTGRSELV